MWQPNPYIIPLFIAAAVAFIFSYYTWLRRDAPGARPFIFVGVGMAIWSLANVLQWSNASFEGQLFWARVRFLGTELVVAAFFIFALQYSGRGKWLNRRNYLLFLIMPAVVLGFLWTNESHGLFWQDVLEVNKGDYKALVFNFGPVFWLHTAYDYLLLTGGIYILTQIFVRAPGIYRIQAASLLLGTLLPWVANMVYIFRLSPIPELDLTPFGFTLGGLLLTLGFFRFQLLDVVPAAREAIVEQMYDGVIVLDDKNRVVDLNPVAERMVGSPAAKAIGMTGAQLLQKWSGLIEKYQDVQELTSDEIVLEIDGQPRHLNLRISPLADKEGKRTGRLLLLQDLTEQRKAEKALRQTLQKTETILESIEDGYFEADLKGNLLYINESFALGVGYPKSEILGRNYRHFTTPGEVRDVFEVFNNIYRTGISNTELEYGIRRRDGSDGIGAASVSLIRSEEGIPMGFRGLIRDVTDRRHAEQAMRRAKEAAERELEIGRRIQAGFLPDVLPVINGWELVSYFQSAREVAGDFYDAFTLSRGKRLAIVIADVCDKGVGAALFMGLFRSLIRAFAFQHYSTSLLDLISNDESLAALGQAGKMRTALPTTGTTALKEAITLTNNYIAQHHGHTNMFATLFFGVLDPQSGVLTYINGGHEPPIILGPEGVKGRLEPTGPAVGMLPDMEFNLVEVTLEPGDTLLAFTDGITEARDGEGNFFGEERLLALISDQAGSAKKLLSSISDEVQDYLGGTIQSDDITMLAVRHVFSTASERRPRSDRMVANLLDNL